MGIKKRIHNIQRIKQIFQVLIKYGFGYIVERLNIEHYFIGRKVLGLRRVRKMEMLEVPPAVKLRKVLEELGPTFVKLGQTLSMRPDLVSLEVARELEKLQDKVPPFEYDKAKEVIARELKKPVGELFVDFPVSPQASASLAQVYETHLLSGEEVVVKVQRPGIETTISDDITILYELAHLAGRYLEEIRLFDPVGVVDEFKRVISRELDFINEAYNVDRFQTHFRGDETVYIPRVYHELSTRRILTLERVKGIKISETEAIAAAGLDTKTIAQNVTDALLKQVLLHGFFHADPHSGNILVLEGNRIGFIDFGMTGHINEQMKYALFSILNSALGHDIPEVRDAFLSVGKADEDLNVEGLDLDLEEFIDIYYGRPLKELNVGHLLSEMIRIVVQHHIRLPADLFLLSKMLITLEAIIQKLYPDFRIIEQARPLIEELRKSRASPHRVARDLRRFIQSLLRFARSLPRDLLIIFSKLKQGTLHVEFEHRGLERLTAQIGRASSRIAFGLIIAAMIVGSSIIMHADRGPQYFGFPILGLVGFIASGILGIWLIIVILSSGRF